MVQFVNCFEVPTGQEEEFFRLWKDVNAYMVRKPGYLGHQLHRAIAGPARFRFVNFGLWESAEHWRNAHDEGFRAMLSQPEWSAFTSTPALYDVVHEGGSVHQPL